MKKIFIWLILSGFIAGIQSQSNIQVDYILRNESFQNKENFFKKIFKWIIGEEKAQLIRPYGWILDQGAGIIFRVEKSKLVPVSTKLVPFRRFPSPVDITSGPGETLLFTDSYLNKVFKINTKDATIHPFIENKKFGRITGIAYSKKAKKIYIVDTGSHSVYIYTEDGNFFSEFGKRGKESGQFNFPTFVALDNQGNVYIVDSMNFRVQVFSPDGKFLYQFGEAGDKPGFMGRPKQIAIDREGHVFIVDVYFQAVQIYDRNGRWLTTFGGLGEEEGHFWLPAGIFINNDHRIFVADTYNKRIQVFRMSNGGNQK